MITKQNWKEFKENFNAQTPYGKYKFNNNEITTDLLLSMFITPFTIVIDILIFSNRSYLFNMFKDYK